MVEKVQAEIVKHLTANPLKKIAEICLAFYGLTFKPDIDDLRESPALSIVSKFAKRHPGRILAVEPNLVELDRTLRRNIFLTDYHTAVETADIHVLLVDHTEFKNLPPPRRNHYRR